MDKAALLKPRLAEEDVALPDGGTVRVRALNRMQVLLVGEVEGNAAARERRMLHYGMIQPKLTEGEAKRWQENAPGFELEPVTDAIARLSGMHKEAAREAYSNFRDGADDGVRTLPSGQAGDDGGPATPVDEQ